MIDINKKYKTRDGRAARILCTDRKSLHHTVVALVTKHDNLEVPRSYTKDGYYYSSGKTPTDHDLVECTPYEDFKIDDKVLVSEDGTHWYNRHFSHEKDGKPYCFDFGAISFTAYKVTDWKYCKKYEGE